MNILISITSWNEKHIPYLQKVLDNYSASFSDMAVSYILSTRYNSSSLNLPNNTTLLTGSRGFTPGHFCWANKHYIHSASFDYLIESDDDILVTRDNFNYYVTHSNILPNNYIPGFLSCETPDSGSPFLITMSPMFKQIENTINISGSNYIVPTNLHSAMFIIDKKRHVSHGSSSKKPYRSSGYNENDLSRTDIYLSSSFTKVIEKASIVNGSALVNHLPNKYYKISPLYKVPRVNSLNFLTN